MEITQDILSAITKGVNKIKKIEAHYVPKECRLDSVWLGAVNDIIDRTALAIRDELEELS